MKCEIYMRAYVKNYMKNTCELNREHCALCIEYSSIVGTEMGRVVRKPAFCICENKDADQLRGNREADQRLCFHHTDSTVPLLPKSEISSL